jgi:hypothetical protein
MTPRAVHHANSWWPHLVSAVIVVTLAAVWWRPAPEAAPGRQANERIDALATLLESSSATAMAIDQRLESLARFPPAVNARRALAEAIVTCRMASLEASRRTALARRLYAITTAGDGDRDAGTIAAAIASLRQDAIDARCDPAAIDQLLSAARAVARIDPSPRRDWW